MYPMLWWADTQEAVNDLGEELQSELQEEASRLQQAKGE